MITPDTSDAAGRSWLIAGFWVRLLAHLIDGLAWGMLTTLVGLTLVALAPNLFGMTGSFLERRECEQLSPVPTHIPLPSDFSPGASYLCAKSIFGLRYRTELIFVEERQVGPLTQRNMAGFPVTPELQLARTLEVDQIFWVGFLIYLVAGQAWWGGTIGKRLLRLRVVGPAGEPPGLRRALLRNGVLWAPAILAGSILLILFATGQFYRAAPYVSFPLGVGFGLLTLAMAAQIWWTATHSRPSIHDRFAGTSVIHSRRILGDPDAPAPR